MTAVRQMGLAEDEHVAETSEALLGGRGRPGPGPGLGPEWRRGAAVLALLLVDWLGVFACLFVSVWFRRGLIHLFPTLGHPYPLPLYIEHLHYLVPWLLVFVDSGMYTRHVLFWDEVRIAVRACVLGALLASFLSFAVRYSDELSRLVIGVMWALTVVVVPTFRYSAKRALARIGWWRKRVLILGAGEVGDMVSQRILANPALGFELVGFVDDDPHKWGTTKREVPVSGPLATIPQIVRRVGAKEVVIAMPRLARDRLLHIVSLCEGAVENIRVVPDLFGLATVGVETEDLDGMLVLRMRWNLAKPWNLAVKRIFDLAVGAVSLVATLPTFLLVTLAIRLDSEGPALLAQERLGRRGRFFRCLKFRTMYLDNEERLAGYLAENPEARREWEEFAKLKSFDPRTTRVGRFLRRFSLDELPQLINILRGEMSLVGPRPYLPRETMIMGDFAQTILKAPPGITGLWQVSGRNELTFAQRLRLDEYYVRNWSLWMDIMVLVKTFGAVFGRGAY